MTSLDPQPDQFIVVDNAPGEEDCRAAVEAVGAEYVREERRGLDNARNAGLRRARSDIVAFTDDDCLPPPTWLRAVPELFSDLRVGAVTGPAFAAAFDTEAQVRFEDFAGFANRGLRRRVYDWTVLSPLRAGRTGAGATMMFRRELLTELGTVFPAELDAGTPTRSGGDLYALYKVLRAGYRVIYAPATYVLHQHRADTTALHDAVIGYGMGLSAALTKIFVEEREFLAIRAWMWLPAQWARGVLFGLARPGEPWRGELGWDYLKGGLAGPLLWRKALKKARARAPAIPAQDQERSRREPRAEHAEQATQPMMALARDPVVSIIVPTAGRPQALRRCLAGLSSQQGSPPFEVIVVNDSPNSLSNQIEIPTVIRQLHTAGKGAAAARNAGARAAAGRILLFLDDDLVPCPGLVAAHVNRHEDRSRCIVVGHSKPRPPRNSLADQIAALWWEDHFRAKAQAIVMTFTHALSGNMSIARDEFLRLGGFAEEFMRFRREDWEWGIRALRSGGELRYEPKAIAAHEFSLDARALIAAGRMEAQGDSLLITRWPRAAASLPAGRRGIARFAATPLRRTAVRVAGTMPVLRIAGHVAAAFEQLHARGLWLRVTGRARVIAYAAGAITQGNTEEPQIETLEIDVGDEGSIRAPQVFAPRVDLLVHGSSVGRISPRDGSWDSSLAEQITDQLPNWALMRLSRAEATPSPDLSEVCVIAGLRHGNGEVPHKMILEEAGAQIEGVVLESDPRHWVTVNDIALESERPLVVVTLPGASLDPRAVGDTIAGFTGNRVEAIAGALPKAGHFPDPLTFLRKKAPNDLFPEVARAMHCLAIRKGPLEALGGFPLSAVNLGYTAPLLATLMEIFDAGGVVGFLDVSTITSDDHNQTGANLSDAWTPRSGVVAGRAAGSGLAGVSRFNAEALWPFLKWLRRTVRRSGPGVIIPEVSDFLRGISLGLRSHRQTSAREPRVPLSP